MGPTGCLGALVRPIPAPRPDCVDRGAGIGGTLRTDPIDGVGDAPSDVPAGASMLPPITTTPDGLTVVPDWAPAWTTDTDATRPEANAAAMMSLRISFTILL